MNPYSRCLLGLVTLIFLSVYSLAQSFSENAVSKPSNDRVIALFEESLEDAGIPIGTEAEELSGIVRWSSRHHRIPQCINWLEYKMKLSPGSLYLRMALGDSLALSGRWEQLVELLQQQQWLYQEHIRLAYLAAGYREQGISKWESIWFEAVEQASVNHEKFHSLVALASTWKEWGSQIEEALWLQMDNSLPLESWSATLLYNVYSAKGNLSGLRKLNDFLLERNPENGTLLNNYIILGILDNDIESIESVVLNRFQEVRDTNDLYQLTYSFYLKTIGKDIESLNILRSVPKLVREDPDNALYVAYLVGDDENLRAELYLALAQEGRYQNFEKAYFLSRGFAVE